MSPAPLFAVITPELFYEFYAPVAASDPSVSEKAKIQYGTKVINHQMNALDMGAYVLVGKNVCGGSFIRLFALRVSEKLRGEPTCRQGFKSNYFS